MRTFFEFLVSGVSFGAAYALLALSINVIYSSSNILSFAQGEFMMLGGMLTWELYSVLHVPYLAAVLGVLVILGALGAVQYYALALPLLRRHAPLISIIIATLGLAIVIRIAAEEIFGKVAQPAHSPVGQGALSIFGVSVLPQSFLIVGVTMLCLVVLWWLYTRTTAGVALRAVAFHPDGARIVGINISPVRAVTFALSGALAGLAGLLVAPLSFASPFVGLTYAINGFAAAIIGGLGSWPGAVVGGFTVGFARAMIAGYVSADWANMLTFGLILAMLYVRPTGIFPERAGSPA
jgi:branched-chain amino acid transport system permease protein